MHHPVDNHVGQRIRGLRRSLGKTQQDLAEAVGIKFQQIQKYETGTNRVSASRLWDIAAALHTPITYFFEGLDEDVADTASQTNAETADLLRAYSKIPAHQRRKLLELACALGQDD